MINLQSVFSFKELSIQMDISLYFKTILKENVLEGGKLNKKGEKGRIMKKETANEIMGNIRLVGLGGI